jgi:hypothetical protein
MKTNFCIIITAVCVLTFWSATACPAKDLNSNKSGSILKKQSIQKKCCAVLKESKGAKNLTGFWKTDFADLCLLQTENKVTGSYNYKGGKLEGTITGNCLDYSWSQEDGKKGKGYFVVTNNWQNINGKYGYNDNSTSGGNWSGKRSVCPVMNNSGISKDQ